MGVINMIGKNARKRFLGQYGERLGCAEAVAASFMEAVPVAELRAEDFADARGGKAPQGYCGALYAALTLAEKAAPHRVQEIKDFFLNHAGGLTCGEIRAQKRMTCADCVERAAELLAGRTGG